MGKIDNFEQIVEPYKGLAIFTTLSSDKRYSPICYKCGSKATGIHDHHQKTVRDLSFGNNPVFIIYNYRKVYCPCCDKIRGENLDIALPGGLLM
ncbi:MAG: transposase family protein [Halanaerobiales bacterium]